MFDRNLRIAFGISLGIHIFVMSAVIIVIPEKIGRKKSFTRVDFLGPILEKTAFDIMLESANPVVRTSYSLGGLPFDSRYLKIPAPGRVSFKQEFPHQVEDSMDNAILEALAGYKAVPDFSLEMKIGDLARDWPAGRKVIYSPEPPAVTSGLYDDKDAVRVRVRALVSPDGAVRKAEPVITTGYPQLDILAAKYVRSWIFEPKKDSGEEWITLDVTLSIKD